MYLTVSLILALCTSQQAWGSPIYFPDEVKVDADGKGFMVLPGVYFHQANNKSVPAMLSIGVTKADDQLSLVMNISAKEDMLESTEEVKPKSMTLEKLDENVNGSDNITVEIGNEMLGNTEEVKTMPLMILLSDGNFNHGANITSVSDINKSENNQRTNNSVLPIDFELLKNGLNNKNNEMALEIRSMDLKIDTKMDNRKSINLAKIKSIRKSMNLKSDSASPLPSEGTEKIILFGDEKSELMDKVFMFPTTRSPVQNNSMEKSEDILNSPVLNPCSVEGDIMYEGICVQLLSSYECPKDQWLVMKGPDVAECVPRPCPFGQILYQDSCVSPDDSSICSKGQMLYVEMTGEAFCDCDPDYIYLVRDGTCVPEYEQGSCDWGKYLVRNEYGSPECVTNPCGRDGSVYHEENKMCYNKNYIGHCEQEQLVIKGNQAECREIFEIVSLRNVFEVPTLRRCPRGSLRDLLHECRRRFNMPSMPSILKAKQFYSNCPPGWTKAHRGRCKKIVDLFSSPK